jgi:hypothetical protein
MAWARDSPLTRVSVQVRVAGGQGRWGMGLGLAHGEREDIRSACTARKGARLACMPMQRSDEESVHGCIAWAQCMAHTDLEFTPRPSSTGLVVEQTQNSVTLHASWLSQALS